MYVLYRTESHFADGNIKYFLENICYLDA
ncbi:hypothetical protein XBP1_2630016 [Xenorhabdus bovienii str. puntauvense]|nr:hypothetical protein XBP1_2630016 [Xenorhabdus bovienii str. puntauvense]